LTETEVVVEPLSRITSVVIWLHGLGATGHDFEPITSQFSHQIRRETRFIFPHAEKRPVTINGGMIMPAWYDIYDVSLGGTVDTEGMDRTQMRLDRYIQETIETGINSQRIVIAGFSQGGVIALREALSERFKLAGYIALSTYLPGSQHVKPASKVPNPPVFLAHGRNDQLIPIEAAELARDQLEATGFDVEWKPYPMQHEVCTQEIADIDSWLLRVLY